MVRAKLGEKETITKVKVRMNFHEIEWHLTFLRNEMKTDTTEIQYGKRRVKIDGTTAEETIRQISIQFC